MGHKKQCTELCRNDIGCEQPRRLFHEYEHLGKHRHYRGGEYTIYSLDAADAVTTATYDILDFHLEIDYAQAAMGNYTDAMSVDVYLELIEDFTGMLPVDPVIPSVYLTSSDLVQHTDGLKIMGAWEIYGSSNHTFNPLTCSSLSVNKS